MTAQGVSLNERRERPRHRSDQWLKDWREGLRKLARILLRRPESEKAARHRAEVAYLEELYDDLRSGIRTWRDWDETLLCPDRQEVAVEECGEALRQERELLAAAIAGGAR